MKLSSVGIFALLILGARIANFQTFSAYIGTFAVVVFLQNALALSLGYWGARAAKLPLKDCKTVAIEVGIQNSGLGLILFFQYFPTLGGVGIITAWWGVWHMISGLTVATYWQRKSKQSSIQESDLLEH
jgi:BASS family bile acid:Na+ symporter